MAHVADGLHFPLDWSAANYSHIVTTQYNKPTGFTPKGLFLSGADGIQSRDLMRYFSIAYPLPNR